MKKIFFIIIILFSLFSCASFEKRINKMPNEKKIVMADSLYERKSYNKARIIYENIVFNKTYAKLHYAQKRLADCYYNQKIYTEALYEYKNFLNLFPDNEYIKDVRYKMIYCYYNLSENYPYTQDETYSTINEIESYMQAYPYDDKSEDLEKIYKKCNYTLYEKEYSNGYIYFKLKDYSSSEMYLLKVLSRFEIDDLDKKSLYYLIRIYSFWKEKDKVEELFNRLKDFYPNSKEYFSIKELLNKY